MTICILHGPNCPNLPQQQGETEGILLLVPPSLPYLEPHPVALTWLKLWFRRAGLDIAEFRADQDDIRLCALSAGVARATALLADITVRDPQVLMGVALAQANGKSVNLLAHERADAARPFEDAGLICYPAGDAWLDPQRPSVASFEREVRDLIARLQTVVQPPPPPPLPVFNAKRFRYVLSQPPGERSEEDRHYVEETWQSVVNWCRRILPDYEWDPAMQWHSSLKFDRHRELLLIRPSIRHRELELLQTPAFRHALEDAVFTLSGRELNWTVAAEVIVTFQDDETE